MFLSSSRKKRHCVADAPLCIAVFATHVKISESRGDETHNVSLLCMRIRQADLVPTRHVSDLNVRDKVLRWCVKHDGTKNKLSLSHYYEEKLLEYISNIFALSSISSIYTSVLLKIIRFLFSLSAYFVF